MNSIYKQTDIQLPNSEKLNETALSIPLHPRLTDDEVTLIIDKIKCSLNQTQDKVRHSLHILKV